MGKWEEFGFMNRVCNFKELYWDKLNTQEKIYLESEDLTEEKFGEIYEDFKIRISGTNKLKNFSEVFDFKKTFREFEVVPSEKNFIFDMGVYPFHLMLSIGETQEELKKSLEDHGAVYNEEVHTIKGSARFCFSDKNQSLILMKKLDSIEDLTDLQHELFHCVVAVMDTVGIPLAEITEEAYAYLLGYLTKNIYTELNIGSRLNKSTE